VSQPKLADILLYARQLGPGGFGKLGQDGGIGLPRPSVIAVLEAIAQLEKDPGSIDFLLANQSCAVEELGGTIESVPIEAVCEPRGISDLLGRGYLGELQGRDQRGGNHHFVGFVKEGVDCGRLLGLILRIRFRIHDGLLSHAYRGVLGRESPGLTGSGRADSEPLWALLFRAVGS
jgi:hypothetical protein